MIKHCPPEWWLFLEDTATQKLSAAATGTGYGKPAMATINGNQRK
jgi:hypothetical protein